MTFDEWWDSQGLKNEWVESWARDAWIQAGVQADLSKPAPEGKEFSDSKRLDWMSLHRPEITYWRPGQKYNGIERSIVEVEWGHTRDKPLGFLVGANTLREAIDAAISEASRLPQRSEE